MKKLLCFALVACSLAAHAQTYRQRDVQVDGHFRQDGQYVQPHHRSAPDHSQYNNYNSQGNSNPYTGQQGSQKSQY